MANILQTIRGKVPSKRALFAIGGTAAIALGVMQTADTMAAGTDAANADASQIASQNFAPVPIISGLACSGQTGTNKVELRWNNLGPDFKYVVEVSSSSGGSAYKSSTVTSPNSGNLQINGGTFKGKVYSYARVRTQNISTGEISEGFSEWFVLNWEATTYCTGQSTGFNGNKDIADWQQQADWNPGTPAHRTSNGASRTAPPGSSDAASPSTPSPSSSTPSAAPSETPSSTPPSAPSTPSSAPSTPSSEAPATTEPSTPAPEPKITVSVGVAGEAAGFTIYKDGVESCSADKAPSDKVNVGGNEVTITTADGAVKKVNPDTCAVS
ncbi:MAG: hypothetical protein WBA38_03330 [Gordonia sp. (in: high G+C Gram-positive bacteria)]|uniref:hypothetical protein n=1 Tax=Gordonia sp. (in: high G+C Gram-positive bacteria) TaxID=84139 RepID=UPI003C78D55E